MASLDDEPTSEFYSLHDAALGLSKALKELDAIEAERSRYTWSMPFHVEQERDRAVSRVRAAIRYLYNETD